MKTLSLVAALSIAAAAACGGTVVVEPIGPDGTKNDPGATSSGGNTSGSTPTTPTPKAPIGPYTGLVGTSDVSILYPMPLDGASKDFIPAGFMGDHGVLFPRAMFDAVAGTSLDRTHSIPPSGFDQLVLVSLRLDPCSARKGAGCTSEVRAVFQAVNRNGVGGIFEDEDKTPGMSATDGAVHVMYEMSEAELVIMMKQILTLKAANGGLADQILGVHPILAAQGLGGPFAKGLQAIILEHLGEDRIVRATTFDHNLGADEDGWTFRIFDVVSGSIVAKKIPTIDFEQQSVIGSRAFDGPLTSTGAETSGAATVADKVGELVARARPPVGSPDVSTKLVPAFQAAVRVQNPNVHNAETVDCTTCHLAEGAKLIGEATYSLVSAQTFTHSRVLEYKSERSSVTNLHAFGYLHRKVSIMQRTANESVLVADAMEKKVK